MTYFFLLTSPAIAFCKAAWPLAEPRLLVCPGSATWLPSSSLESASTSPLWSSLLQSSSLDSRSTSSSLARRRLIHAHKFTIVKVHSCFRKPLYSSPCAHGKRSVLLGWHSLRTAKTWHRGGFSTKQKRKYWNIHYENSNNKVLTQSEISFSLTVLNLIGGIMATPQKNFLWLKTTVLRSAFNLLCSTKQINLKQDVWCNNKHNLHYNLSSEDMILQCRASCIGELELLPCYKGPGDDCVNKQHVHT